MLKFAPIFTEHAVLQREKPVRIFGSCKDGSTVTLRLGSISRSSVPAAGGRWEIILPPLPAGGPYTISITDGTETAEIADVMIGEVWLCGGQSNIHLVGCLDCQLPGRILPGHHQNCHSTGCGAQTGGDCPSF